MHARSVAQGGGRVQVAAHSRTAPRGRHHGLRARAPGHTSFLPLRPLNRPLPSDRTAISDGTVVVWLSLEFAVRTSTAQDKKPRASKKHVHDVLPPGGCAASGPEANGVHNRVRHREL